MDIERMSVNTCLVRYGQSNSPILAIHCQRVGKYGPLLERKITPIDQGPWCPSMGQANYVNIESDYWDRIVEG